MRYFIGLLALLVACQSKDKENPVAGKWEYQRMEMYDGTPVNLGDSMVFHLHQQQKGLTFSFSGNDVFTVTHLRENNREEFIAEQPYELMPDNKILRLINKGRPDDNFPIVALSDSLLKINIFYSDKAYMVFARKQQRP